MIVLTPSGLVSITALPSQPDSPWVMVRANRPQDITAIMPGVPTARTSDPEAAGWQFVAFVTRRMVTKGLADCVESVKHPPPSDAVSVQDQQLAELSQGILTIAAEMPWDLPQHADGTLLPDLVSPTAPPPPDVSSATQGHDTSAPAILTFDSGDASPDQSPLTTYDGPSPVISEDPYDQLIPAEPTLCQLRGPQSSQGTSPPASSA